MKGVFGDIEVKTNHYVVGKQWSQFEGREAHHILGVFNNVDDAITCISENLPADIDDYIDSQYYILKEDYDKAVAICPEIESCCKTREVSDKAWEIEFPRRHEMPVLNAGQRLQLADMFGYTFATWDDTTRYYINRVALVPVEVIK